NAISTAGNGYTAYIQGSVFGATVGLFSPSGSNISVTISPTGSVFGGQYGIETLGTTPSTYIDVEGTLYGYSVGFASALSTNYTYVHVGATGTASSVGTGTS